MTDKMERSTGAHVVQEPDAADEHTISVEAQALDDLLAPYVSETDRLLLKLDLQGFELEALQGAHATLNVTEVILTEVSFFAQAYEPQIAELVAFLDNRGFALYDIASLHARPRDGRPRQGDFVFVKKDSPLAKDTAWE